MQYSVSNGEGKFIIEVAEHNRDEFVTRMENKGYIVEEVGEDGFADEDMTKVRSGDLVAEVMHQGNKQAIFYGGLEKEGHVLICEQAIFNLDKDEEVTPYACRRAFGEYFGKNIYRVTLPCGIIHYEACTDDEMEEKRTVYRSLAASVHTESRSILKTD